MDFLLKEFFNPDRWSSALEKGAGEKRMNKASMRLLEDPAVRINMYQRIENGTYQIMPPHQQLIPKDNGDFRTVYINEDADRILLSIVNDMLFELMPETIHPACTSYQKGIGCGKVVKNVSKNICESGVGWKSDLSKYFDSVPIEFIDNALDMIEEKFGKSKLIDVIRKYYHCDLCFNPDGELISQYQSLKQGCATASWLADVLLYHIDEQLSNLDGYYVRYSDDTLFVGKDYAKAMHIMQDELGKMQMKLNPKKVEYLSPDRWFKFLGFSIRGAEISLSKGRLNTFQKEIEKRTIHSKASYEQARANVLNYLYKGDGSYSLATSVLPIINVDKDINLLNGFVMDCLRASKTKHNKVGGLGYDVHGKDGVIVRGCGKNVKSNKEKMPHIDKYYSLALMRNAMLTNRDAYDVLCLQM